MIIITNPGTFAASDPFGCSKCWLKAASMVRFPLPPPSKLNTGFFSEPQGLEGLLRVLELWR